MLLSQPDYLLHVVKGTKQDVSSRSPVAGTGL